MQRRGPYSRRKLRANQQRIFDLLRERDFSSNYQLAKFVAGGHDKRRPTSKFRSAYKVMADLELFGIVEQTNEGPRLTAAAKLVGTGEHFWHPPHGTKVIPRPGASRPPPERTPEIVRADIEAIVNHSFFAKEADDFRDAARVVLASCHVGPNAKKVARFLGLPLSFVRQCGAHLRHSGVWDGHKVAPEWNSEASKDYPLVGVTLDALCALGILERTTDSTPGVHA